MSCHDTHLEITVCYVTGTEQVVEEHCIDALDDADPATSLSFMFDFSDLD